MKLTENEIDILLGLLDTARIDAILEDNTLDPDELQIITEKLKEVQNETKKAN